MNTSRTTAIAINQHQADLKRELTKKKAGGSTENHRQQWGELGKSGGQCEGETPPHAPSVMLSPHIRQKWDRHRALEDRAEVKLLPAHRAQRFCCSIKIQHATRKPSRTEMKQHVLPAATGNASCHQFVRCKNPGEARRDPTPSRTAPARTPRSAHQP